MRFNAHVEDLERLVKTPEEKQNEAWAYAINSRAGEIHEGVWDYHPKPSFVGEVLIPLFDKASEIVCGFSLFYAKLIRIRIKNLIGYTRGKPSDFARMVGAPEYIGGNMPLDDPNLFAPENFKPPLNL